MDDVGRGVRGGDGDGGIIRVMDVGGEDRLDGVSSQDHDGGGHGRVVGRRHELDDGVMAGVVGRGHNIRADVTVSTGHVGSFG